MNITIKDRETGLLLCPECYSSERITFNDVFIYCARCGLELITPYPNKSSQAHQLRQKDKERYKKHFGYSKIMIYFNSEKQKTYENPNILQLDQ